MSEEADVVLILRCLIGSGFVTLDSYRFALTCLCQGGRMNDSHSQASSLCACVFEGKTTVTVISETRRDKQKMPSEGVEGFS